MSSHLELIREGSQVNTVKIHRESSSNANSVCATNKQSKSLTNREKLAQLKEIKKYLDSLFKDLKEAVQQVAIMEASNIKIHPEIIENLNKQIKKCFRRIELNIYQIESYIGRVFKEFNQLFLIHESKLGHSLKDLQQFLNFYGSCDRQIQSLAGKIDMILDIQENKMFTELFGENKLSSEALQKLTRKQASHNHDRHDKRMPPPLPPNIQHPIPFMNFLI